MNPLLLGFVRGLGTVLIMAALGYLGHAENLPFLNPIVAGLLASVALGFENQMTVKTGNALFGAVKA